MSGSIVAVTSLALEARIASGQGVSVICSQGARLAAALESAVARDHQLWSCGRAGAQSGGRRLGRCGRDQNCKAGLSDQQTVDALPSRAASAGRARANPRNG